MNTDPSVTQTVAIPLVGLAPLEIPPPKTMSHDTLGDQMRYILVWFCQNLAILALEFLKGTSKWWVLLGLLSALGARWSYQDKGWVHEGSLALRSVFSKYNTENARLKQERDNALYRLALEQGQTRELAAQLARLQGGVATAGATVQSCHLELAHAREGYVENQVCVDRVNAVRNNCGTFYQPTE